MNTFKTMAGNFTKGSSSSMEFGVLESFDILLFTNSKTTQNEISVWRSLFEGFNLKMNIQDISHHNGISMKKLMKDGKTQLQDLRGKTCIYLNNTVIEGNKDVPASNLIESKEFLNAAYHYGTHILIFGGTDTNLIRGQVNPINQSLDRQKIVFYKDANHLLKSFENNNIINDSECGQFIPKQLLLNTGEGNLSFICLINNKKKQLVYSKVSKIISIYKNESSVDPIHSFNFKKLNFSLSGIDEIKNSFKLSMYSLNLEITIKSLKPLSNIVNLNDEKLSLLKTNNDIANDVSTLYKELDSIKQIQQQQKHYKLSIPNPYQTMYREQSFTFKNQLMLNQSVQEDEDDQLIRYVPSIQVIINRKFSKPNENDIINYSNELLNKLKSIYPNQRNFIYYDYNPETVPGWGNWILGTIEIHRSLDKTDTHLSHLHFDNDNTIQSIDTINSTNTIYQLFKILDFRVKLELLDTLSKQIEISNNQLSNIAIPSSKIGTLLLSICSDLAEEQFHFRNGSYWRDSLTVDLIKSNLLKLNLLKVFKFTNNHGTAFKNLGDQILPLSDLIIEIGVHLKIMIDNFSQGLKHKILPFRRTTDVNNVTNSLWDDIIKIHLFDWKIDNNNNNVLIKPTTLKKYTIDSCTITIKNREIDKRNEWFNHIKSILSGIWGHYFNELGNKDKILSRGKEVIQAYRKPPFNSSCQLDTDIEFEDLVIKKDEHTYILNKSNQSIVYDENNCSSSSDKISLSKSINNNK